MNIKKFLKKIFIFLLPVRAYLFIVKHFSVIADEGYKRINKQIFFQLLSKQKNAVSFIQIGANDGVTNDPIHTFIKKYKWKGTLVEPLPDFFKKLKENYAGETQLNFENLGIGNKEDLLQFYYLPTQYNNPEWLQQIGTFSKEAIEINLKNQPAYLPLVEAKSIPVITLSSLIQRSKLLDIDLLVIDAEGFEFQILSQLEKASVKPNYIFYEWGCMTEEENKALQQILINLGYEFYAASGDLLAVKKQIFSENHS